MHRTQICICTMDYESSIPWTSPQYSADHSIITKRARLSVFMNTYVHTRLNNTNRWSIFISQVCEFENIRSIYLARTTRNSGLGAQAHTHEHPQTNMHFSSEAFLDLCIRCPKNEHTLTCVHINTTCASGVSFLTSTRVRSHAYIRVTGAKKHT